MPVLANVIEPEEFALGDCSSTSPPLTTVLLAVALPLMLELAAAVHRQGVGDRPFQEQIGAAAVENRFVADDRRGGTDQLRAVDPIQGGRSGDCLEATRGDRGRRNRSLPTLPEADAPDRIIALTAVPPDRMSRKLPPAMTRLLCVEPLVIVLVVGGGAENVSSSPPCPSDIRARKLATVVPARVNACETPPPETVATVLPLTVAVVSVAADPAAPTEVAAVKSMTSPLPKPERTARPPYPALRLAATSIVPAPENVSPPDRTALANSSSIKPPAGRRCSRWRCR